ncbi:MAG: deoxyribonuclease IV [Fimbriimonas sp.]
MGAKLIGAHMKTAVGLASAVRGGAAIGCTAVQVFTSSPQQWRAKPVTEAMVADFKAAKQETGIQHVISHDSYLINLAADDEELRTKSIAGIKGELDRCAQYGIPYAVSHMGSHKGLGEEVGLYRAALAALEVLAETDPSVTILMETTAGQGSSLNYRFEQIARLLELTKGEPRLCVCLDTCHIFAAGYDIRTEAGYEDTLSQFQSLIGFDRLKAVHCNDSKKPFASRLDRHDHIGEGEIGLVPFRLMMNDSRFENIPILLETPDGDEFHSKNLNTLKSLIVS